MPCAQETLSGSGTGASNDSIGLTHLETSNVLDKYHLGPCFDRTSDGRMFCIKCRKEAALGSASAFADGLSTVYGWQDGDMSQRDASNFARAVASRQPMSIYTIGVNRMQKKRTGNAFVVFVSKFAL